MPNLAQIKLPSPVRLAISSISGKRALMVLSVLILAPLAAHAQFVLNVLAEESHATPSVRVKAPRQQTPSASEAPKE